MHWHCWRLYNVGDSASKYLIKIHVFLQKKRFFGLVYHFDLCGLKTKQSELAFGALSLSLLDTLYLKPGLYLLLTTYHMRVKHDVCRTYTGQPPKLALHVMFTSAQLTSGSPNHFLTLMLAAPTLINIYSGLPVGYLACLKHLTHFPSECLN